MGNRVRKGQGGGMMKSPISMILVMIFIFIAIGGIASQGGVLSDIGKSLADLLNPNKPTIADFELAKKSTDVLTCAVASSFLGEEWSGSSSVNCDYGIKKSAKVEGKIIAMGSEGPITIPNTLNTDIGSSSSITGLHVGKVTGAASGDEIELTVDEARKLTPMVECTKDNGKVTGCTVKNFLLPQEIDSWEEWILYWGDPQFAVYWNMFPVEEDTWNFDIEWGHHAVIFGLSLLPWGRLFGTGASATATLVRGPGKKLIARELAEPIVDGFTAVSRNAFKANMDEFVEFTVLKTAREQVLRKFSKEGIAASESIIKQEIDKLLPTLTPSVRASLGLTDEVVEKVFTVGVKGMKESDITQFARGLQNFDKKTLLKMARESAEQSAKKGRWYYIKKTLEYSFIKKTKERIIKYGDAPIKSFLKDGLFLGTKVATLELAIHMLAASSMEKYVPVGNAISLKVPNFNVEASKTLFSLPSSMKGKPVLLSWDPKNDEIKNLHFSSPCYLSEINVKRVDKVLCEKYKTDGEISACEVDEDTVNDESPLICQGIGNDKIDWGMIDKEFEFTGDKKFSDKIKDFFAVKEKPLFGFYGNWTLRNITLPWPMKKDNSGPEYQIVNIRFSSEGYGPGVSTSDLYIGSDLHDGLVGGVADRLTNQKYEGLLTQVGKDTILVEINKESHGDDYKNVPIMKSGDEYILHIYTGEKDHVAIDIYDPNKCDKMMGVSVFSDDFFADPITSCSDLNKNIIEVSSSDDIKNKIETVQSSKDKLGIKIKFTPSNSMSVMDFDPDNWGVGNCGDILRGKQLCFRKSSGYENFVIWGIIECSGFGSVFRRISDIEVSGRAGGLYDFTVGCTISDDISKKLGVEKIAYTKSVSAMYSANEMNNFITDINYDALMYKINDDVLIGFNDADSDEQWDEMSIQTDDPDFGISFADITKDGDFEYVGKSKCVTDAVMVTFNTDSAASSKIVIKDGENYCVRQVSGGTQTLNTVLKIAGTAGIIVGVIVLAVISRGAAVPAIAGKIIFWADVAFAAGVFTTELKMLHQQVWPESAGG